MKRGPEVCVDANYLLQATTDLAFMAKHKEDNGRVATNIRRKKNWQPRHKHLVFSIKERTKD